MAEIGAIQVPALLKGKKGAYLGIGIAAVAIFAVVMKSRASGSATSGVSPDNIGANLAGLGNAMQQSNQELAAHLDSSNATMAASIADAAALTSQQGTEINTIQEQIKTALGNESSIIGSIGSLSAAVNAQAHQVAAPAPYVPPYQEPAAVIKSIFGASTDLTSAMARFSGSGYRFVNTEGMAAGEVQRQLKAAGASGLIAGGHKAGGGVTNEMAAGTGVVRVAGNTAEDTAKLLQSIQF